MRTKTGQYMKCPVCNMPMPVVVNIKGRIQAWCKECHTAVFLNKPSAVELAELKGIIAINKNMILERGII